MKTIADIARAAGVSKSTVSRVLNQRPGVNPQARQQIQQLIDQSHFTANITAKNLKARNSDTVGILIPLITSKTVASYIHGMSHELESNHIQILLMNTNMDTQKASENIRTLNSKGVDGMIVLVAGYDQALITSLKESECPAVVVGQDLSMHQVPSVFFDDYRCGYIAGQRLLEAGASKLLFLGIPAMDVALGRQRRRGFEDALSMSNVQCEYVTDCQLNAKSGWLKTQQLLASGYRPDGIFAVTDRLAAGASKAVLETGMQVGQDVAIVGVGDDEICELMTPSLASVHYDYPALGREASKVLMALISGKQPEQYAYTHQGSFHWRESCQLAGNRS